MNLSYLMVTSKQYVIFTLKWNTDAGITSQNFSNVGVNKISDANYFSVELPFNLNFKNLTLRHHMTQRSSYWTQKRVCSALIHKRFNTVLILETDCISSLSIFRHLFSPRRSILRFKPSASSRHILNSYAGKSQVSEIRHLLSTRKHPKEKLNS